ncbi:MAG: hypothetical protein ABSF03_20135 [Streptosporangiaceae bacterium]
MAPLAAGIILSYAVFAFLAIRHIWLAMAALNGPVPYVWPYSAVFLLLAWQMTACFLEQPHKCHRGATEDLNTVTRTPRSWPIAWSPC